MELTGLDRFFWAAGFAGHIILLAVLVSTKKSSRFPFFTAFIAFLVVKTIALFYLQRFGPGVYFYSYWSLSFADALLELLVLGEIARKIFRPGDALIAELRRPLTLIALGSICVAALLAFLASPPGNRIELSIVVRGQLFSTVMISELFAGLLFISVTSGFSWSTHVGVILRGLGIFSVFSLVAQGLEGFFGTGHGSQLFNTFSQLQILVYLVCLSYWIIGLSKPVPETGPLPEKVRFRLLQLNTHLASVISDLRFRKGSS